ncbi:MAG TPA: MFS transporter [Terracidiphilus sp.]|nr:MFS transporter [Terracidiphilus sp.]
MVPTKTTHVRYLIVLMLFLASTFSYGDRVVLSIAAVDISRNLRLDALHLGYLFSGFGWSYAAAQLPAGSLLDRFGSKRVYGISILSWSCCAIVSGFTGYLSAVAAFYVLFALRLLSGLAQSPVFPGNGRIVAAWCPTAERGRASAIFNSSQYFSLVLFGPLMGWIAHVLGWKQCFWCAGLIALALAAVWFRVMHGVRTHPRINRAEIELIESGGGLVSLDGSNQPRANTLTWPVVRWLLGTRMLIGIYLGQYCITTLTWFFLTWFPIYLSQTRHLSMVKAGFLAAVPALCGFTGGILGGMASDRMLKAGYSLTLARKVPIVAGMLLAITIVVCNYVNSALAVTVLMSLAFFGKGFGALGWTVISDTSPKGLVGVNGGMFNLIGNLAGITTPIVIGAIVKGTGTFQYALVFVAATALLAIVAYLPIVGEIRRLECPASLLPASSI